MRTRTGRTLAAAWLLLSPGEAQAYLDPGSDSLIFQALIASVAGGLLLFKTRWRQVRSFLKREPTATEPKAAQPGEPGDDGP